MTSSANVAAIALRLESGTDLADKINPRLTELTLAEKRSEDADELSITLQNADGLLAIPETGVNLLLQLGWKSGSAVPVGMVDKGRFTVDEVGQQGPPDVVTIRARSADLTGLYRKRQTRIWKDTTLGAILREIAARHGGEAQVAGELAVQPIAAIEQEGKSDMAFVRDLGQRYDAVATWKGGKLIFLPIGASATAGGAALATITLTKRDGWSWRFAKADRDSYDGAEAQWHDPDEARRKTVGTGGENPKKLKRVYASEAEAQQAAEAATKRAARVPFTFEYDLAIADPALQPDQRVTLQGWSERIDAIAWLVESVETTYGARGMVQRIVLESA